VRRRVFSGGLAVFFELIRNDIVSAQNVIYIGTIVILSVGISFEFAPLASAYAYSRSNNSLTSFQWFYRAYCGLPNCISFCFYHYCFCRILLLYRHCNSFELKKFKYATLVLYICIKLQYWITYTYIAIFVLGKCLTLGYSGYCFVIIYYIISSDIIIILLLFSTFRSALFLLLFYIDDRWRTFDGFVGSGRSWKMGPLMQCYCRPDVYKIGSIRIACQKKKSDVSRQPNYCLRVYFFFFLRQIRIACSYFEWQVWTACVKVWTKEVICADQHVACRILNTAIVNST